MSVVYSTTADQYNHKAQIGGTWANIQGDASSASDGYNNGVTNSSFAIYSIQSPRAGGTFFLWRTYLPFDLSGETLGTVESAVLSVGMDNVGTSTGDAAKIIAIEATALAGNSDDYGNVYSTGTTFGTVMSAAFSVSDTFGYQDIPITGDASAGGIKEIQDHIASGTVTIGLITWYFDYSGNTPSVSGDETKIRVYYRDYGLARSPKLTITYVAAAVTDNAVFFGANF